MSSSAVFLGLIGIAANFLPAELLALLGIDEPRLEVFVQIGGGAYLGFAFLNWTARGILIGGIYARPVALGNFLHFIVAAIALAKAALDTQTATLVGLLVPYAAFGAWFLVVLLRAPVAEAS
jgi:hypothetical protein